MKSEVLQKYLNDTANYSLLNGIDFQIGRDMDETFQDIVYKLCQYRNQEGYFPGLALLKKKLKKEHTDYIISVEKKLKRVKRTDLVAKQLYEYLRTNNNQTIAETTSKFLDDIPGLKADYAKLCKNHNKLVTGNLGLAISIAKKYRGGGMDFDDLIQEGNIGLIKAAYYYDYKKGFRFSTYASWWIRQLITRSLIDKGTTIRIAAHRAEDYKQISQVMKYLYNKNMRKPTTEEVVKESWIKKEIVEEYFSKISLTSLETPISEELNLGDIVPNNCENPEQITEKNSLERSINKIYMSLKPREEKVLRARFEKEATLEEIGWEIGITRERVRQIEKGALKKIEWRVRRLGYV